jgi:hypothetical protein
MRNKLYTIRDLANSNKYQSLLNARSEICEVRLFNNNSNFSRIQLMFINWLQFYKFLRSEVVSDEVSDVILKDEIYSDSYYLWRSKKYKEYLEKKDKKEEPSSHALKITHRKRK